MTDKLLLPDNITLLPLPPKSPELSPMDNVWTNPSLHRVFGMGLVHDGIMITQKPSCRFTPEPSASSRRIRMLVSAARIHLRVKGIASP